jgi:hypothetical protein
VDGTVPFFEWIVVLACCMVAAVVSPCLVATRVCPAEPGDPGNHGMRKALLWTGVVTDVLAAVFAGSLLGVPWWPALGVGLLFFAGKLGLVEIAARRLHPGPVEQLSEEEVQAREERMRARVEELRASSGSYPKQGLAAWSGFALIHLTALLFLLFLFRLGMGG